MKISKSVIPVALDDSVLPAHLRLLAVFPVADRKCLLVWRSILSFLTVPYVQPSNEQNIFASREWTEFLCRTRSERLVKDSGHSGKSQGKRDPEEISDPDA